MSRNAPCPCGSGRKFKRCHGMAKPRSTVITGKFGEPVEACGVVISQAGTIALLDDHGRQLTPASAHVQTQYPRPKGAKVLNAGPVDPAQIPTRADAALLGFDLVYAVDTNTREIRGKPVSVTAVVLGKSQLPRASIFAFAPTQAIEHREVTCDPERLGWSAVVRGISMNADLAGLRRIALVVDAHLGEIPAINSRTAPIIDDELLPPRFTLLYASADAGKESILNKMIAVADQEASALLRQIEGGEEWAQPSLPLLHRHAAYVRMWQLDGER